MNKQRRRRVNCDENEDPTSNSKPIIYDSEKPKTSKVMFMEEIDYKMEISQNAEPHESKQVVLGKEMFTEE